MTSMGVAWGIAAFMLAVGIGLLFATKQ